MAGRRLRWRCARLRVGSSRVLQPASAPRPFAPPVLLRRCARVAGGAAGRGDADLVPREGVTPGRPTRPAVYHQTGRQASMLSSAAPRAGQGPHMALHMSGPGAAPGRREEHLTYGSGHAHECCSGIRPLPDRSVVSARSSLRQAGRRHVRGPRRRHRPPAAAAPPVAPDPKPMAACLPAEPHLLSINLPGIDAALIPTPARARVHAHAAGHRHVNAPATSSSACAWHRVRFPA